VRGPPCRAPRRRPRGLPVILAAALVAAAVVLGVRLSAGSAPRAACPAAAPRQASFVPAFFEPPDWSRAVSDGHAPGVMILNPASGPGTAPDPGLRSSVRAALAAGSRVIGYIGTSYGQLPAATARGDVREYRDWYHVSGIFLDQTPTQGSGQLGYYQGLAGYIRGVIPGADIWINPGSAPARGYMSLGGVVMIFEGTWAQYRGLALPAWTRDYPAARFAHTIYATPQADVASAVRLSRQRNAGYLFLTPDGGPNPYGALPAYWPLERAAVASGCPGRLTASPGQ
jgi:Spherulation-specific family 4